MIRRWFYRMSLAPLPRLPGAPVTGFPVFNSDIHRLKSSAPNGAVGAMQVFVGFLAPIPGRAKRVIRGTQRAGNVSCRFANRCGVSIIAQPPCQCVSQQLRIRIGDDLQASGPDLMARCPRAGPMCRRGPDHIARRMRCPAAEAVRAWKGE
jgi:hypothetical protein